MYIRGKGGDKRRERGKDRGKRGRTKGDKDGNGG